MNAADSQGGEEAPAPSVEIPPQTAPQQITVSARGFESEEAATSLANLVCSYVQAFSSYIEMGTLDGITIAYDYDVALRELDRGRQFNTALAPSNGAVIGVAMTPTVWRDGTVKSHIVAHAGFVRSLEDSASADYSHAVYLLAHESAHVEVSHKLDAAFPGFIGSSAGDLLDGLRWDAILGCWDEYAASLISAPFGYDPTDDYENTFVGLLASTRSDANELIKEYRLHGDVDRVLKEIFAVYGTLMRIAAYHLGNLAGRDLEWQGRAETTEALEGHWFAPFFVRLAAELKDVMKDYGRWQDKRQFERVGDILEDIVADAGLFIRRGTGGGLYVDIPFHAGTMP